ncbi:MAG: hypothetical protein M1831_004978 [Alyxoria varia]|nr:MAG: hypothetical protein M1831_004978 [Alyxoria varia]
MRTSHLLTSVVAFSTFSAAWPWPPSIADLQALNPLQPRSGYAHAPVVRRQDDRVHADVAKRQDDGGDGGDSGGDSGGNNSDAPSRTTANGRDSNSPDPTPPPTGSASATGARSTANRSGSDSSDSEESSSDVDIDPQDRPASVNMLTPGSTDASSYYKVSNTITWEWEYEDLKAKPSAIDVLATVSPSASGPAPSAFTLTTNMTYEATQTFKWDTGEYADKTSALPVGTYTLIIYDADQPKGVSATPKAGYLQPYEQFRFGMYTPQAYTSLSNQYVCATCNAAMGKGEQVALSFVFGMAMVTVGSFTWFAGMWGILF